MNVWKGWVKSKKGWGESFKKALEKGKKGWGEFWLRLATSKKGWGETKKGLTVVNKKINWGIFK